MSASDSEDDRSSSSTHTGPAGGASQDVSGGEPQLPGDPTVQTGQSTSTGREIPSPVDFFEFDAVLAFADEDETLAGEMEEKMNTLQINEGEKAKVCLYNHPRFGYVTIDRPLELVKKCRFVFLVLTKNTESDKITKFTKDEVIAYAIHNRKQCVRYLHTSPLNERKYIIPSGLGHIVPLTWYEPFERCEKELVELFRYHRENPRETSLHKDGPKSSTDDQLKQAFSKTKTSNGKEGPNSRDLQEQMSPELKRISYETTMILRKWQEEMFYLTFATREAKETLKVKGCVFIVGRSGDGKTSSVYHILTDLAEEKTDFKPYIITKPEDMNHIPPKNSIVFVDNIFGANNFSSILLEKWRVCFKCIDAYVDAGDMYFIATSPSHVRDECCSQLAGILVLSHVIDMAGEHRLRDYEKKNMLTEFLESNGVDMSAKAKQKAAKSSLTIGFPQCCKLFVTNHEAQDLGADFFQKPFEFLNCQISKLKSSENDKLPYLVLVKCVFEKGKFPSEMLNPFSSSSVSFENLKEACGVKQDTTLNEIRMAAEKLCHMGYLEKNVQEGSYRFSHQSIYDAVCLSFGNDYVKKIIEMCPLKFLVRNTALCTDGADEKKNIVQVPLADKSVLVKRLITELQSGHFMVLEHNCFRDSKEFKEVFRKILTNPSLLFKFTASKMLFYLTASKKYRSLILFLKDTIKNFPKDRFQEEHVDEITQVLHEMDESMSTTHINLYHNILKCKDVAVLYGHLLHQCLEGSCFSGDTTMFKAIIKTGKTTPCENCFQKAVESPFDQPETLKGLLMPGVLGYVNKLNVVEALIKMKKINSLSSVLESAEWKCSVDSRNQQKLFSVACCGGNFEIFCLLQKIFPVKDYTEEHLFKAVTGQNKQIIESLLSEDNINCVDKFGRTLLHHACLKMPQICDLLIKKGVDHSVIDKAGMSALHLAIQHQDKATVENLIGQKLQLTMGGKQDENDLQEKSSPLHMAAQNDKGFSMVDLLIQNGPRDVDMVNFQDSDGMTPLHIAADKPHGYMMIEELMRKNADPSIKDKQKKTALHYAAKANIPNNIHTLLKHSAPVNEVDKKGKTALHYVLSAKEDMHAQLDSVNHLLSKGADVNVSDGGGNRCIHIAAKCTSVRVIRKITERADDHVGLNNEGNSPLELLLHPSAKLESVNLLVSKYPSLLQQKSTESLLNLALRKMVPYNIVEYILEKVPCAAEHVEWNEDILFKAISYYKEDLDNFLQQCGSYFPSSVLSVVMMVLCFKTVDEKWTECMNCLELEDSFFSEERNWHPIYFVLDSPIKIKWFISKGISVNTTDRNGNTLLHIAASRGCAEGVDTLLEAGADVNKINKEKNTALHVTLLHWLNLSRAFHRLHSVCRSDYFHSLKSLIAVKLSEMCHIDFLFKDEYFVLDTKPKALDAQYRAILSSLLEKEMSINTLNDGGFTPLHYGVHDKDVLDQLILAGGNMQLTAHNGWSCLHSACVIKDNDEVVNLILDSGLSPCQRGLKGIACLHVALFSGFSDIKTLERLAHCVQEEPTCQCQDHWPFLHVATLCSVKELVVMLIEKSPDMLFREDKDGYLPIHYAVFSGNMGIIKIVSDAMKADFERREPTQKCTKGVSQEKHLSAVNPLMHKHSISSTRLGHSKTTDEVQCAISNASSVDDQRFFISEVSSHQKQKMLLPVLKSWEDAHHANTLLHFAARYSSPAVLNFLLEEGYEVNISNADGNAPLHAAVAYGTVAAVHCLLDKGAQTDYLNKKRLMPMQYAVLRSKPQPDNLLKLLEFQASIKIHSKQKKSLLHLLCGNYFFTLVSRRTGKSTLAFTDATLTGMLKLFSLVIERDDRMVNKRDKYGQTPLHMAAAVNNAVSVNILLDHNAEIDAVDSQGRTPLHRAMETKYVHNFAAACCLVERGANPRAMVDMCQKVLDLLKTLDIRKRKYLLSAFDQEGIFNFDMMHPLTKILNVLQRLEVKGFDRIQIPDQEIINLANIPFSQCS